MTHEILVFEAGARSFGLPIGDIERVVPAVRPVPLPHAPAAFEGILNLQGTAIPVLDLCAWLGDAPREVRLEDLMIVLRTGSTHVALHVERARGVFEIASASIQPAETILPSARHFAGVAMVEGGIVFLPDVANFIAAAQKIILPKADAA